MLTIVFDLDGTLIDTADDLISTLNLILTGEGLLPMDYDTARRLIGGGVRAMIERAVVAEGRACPKAELDRMFGAYIEHYAAHIADRSRPFPQAEAALQYLAGQGHRLAICTNKLEWLAVRLLDALTLSRYFAAICGQDTFGIQKPDPRMLRQTIERAGGDPARAIMVGDSGTDIRTARAVPIPVVAVDFGYSEVPISTLKPDRIIGAFADLPAAIKELAAELVQTP